MAPRAGRRRGPLRRRTLGPARPEESLSPFVREAARGARAFLTACCAPVPRARRWWSRAPSTPPRRWRKLGLGSSAAVTVAAFAAIVGSRCSRAQPSPPATRPTPRPGPPRLGADVAAAIWGGALRFAVRGAITPLNLDPDQALLLVDTGTPAPPPTASPRWRSFAGHREALLRPLRELSLAAAAATVRDGVVPIAAVREWSTALEPLAAALGLEIVTDHHRQIAPARRPPTGPPSPPAPAAATSPSASSPGSALSD